MSGLINWSQDPASNGLIDPPINFDEGVPANTVNNSLRALMAGLASWRADNDGSLTAVRGAGDVYRAATNQVFGTVAAAGPHTIAFAVDAANQGPAKLGLDGNVAKPLRRQGGHVLAPGDLSPDILYTARATRDGSAYVIVSPHIARPGLMADLGMATPDPGWLLMDGSAISRTSYAALFAAIGTAFGAGDGTTTFNLPDARGRGRYGADRGANRLTVAGGVSGELGSVGGAETVTLTTAQIANHGHSGSTGAAGGHDHGGSTGSAGAHDHGAVTGQAGGHGHGATIADGGAHNHTGSTGSAGAHGHTVRYNPGSAGSGTSNSTAYAIGDAGASTPANTSLDGAHAHGFTTDPSGSHSHGVSIATASDHGHTIAAATAHQHTIAAASSHTHTVTVDAAGGGGAHPNMPPALVVAAAIKA